MAPFDQGHCPRASTGEIAGEEQMRGDDEIRKELQFHIDECAADFVTSGLSLEEVWVPEILAH
jgi:hypothetical protein